MLKIIKIFALSSRVFDLRDVYNSVLWGPSHVKELLNYNIIFLRNICNNVAEIEIWVEFKQNKSQKSKIFCFFHHDNFLSEKRKSKSWSLKHSIPQIYWGSIPGHEKKQILQKKQPNEFFNFPVHEQITFTLYHLSVQYSILSKNNVHTSIKKYFIIKKCCWAEPGWRHE